VCLYREEEPDNFQISIFIIFYRFNFFLSQVPKLKRDVMIVAAAAQYCTVPDEVREAHVSPIQVEKELLSVALGVPAGCRVGIGVTSGVATGGVVLLVWGGFPICKTSTDVIPSK